MAYDIGPRIGIDGESEFRKAIQNVNQQVRTLTSEMEVMVSSFTDGDDAEKKLAEQTRILNQQIEAQEKKVTLLNQGLDSSARKYGEADTKTLKWRETVNKATTQLNKFKSQLDDAENGVEDFSDAADDSRDSLDGYGELLHNFQDALGTVKNTLVGGAVVQGVKELAGTILELEESTREYRQIVGTLEATTEQWGYGVEETKEAYKRLYGVLGDDQATATTLQNLMAIGLTQEELLSLIDQTTGAWAQYGDSIPIDGLAEAINETIKAGQVTGVFADVLNWGSREGETFGVTLKDNIEFVELSKKELESLTDTQRAEYEATKAQYEAIDAYNQSVQDAQTAEDNFNIALQNTTSEQERLELVMKTLSEQGLASLGETWRDVNGDIVEANESQMRMNEAMGRLGETVAPLADGIRNFGADAIDWLVDKIEAVIPMLEGMAEAATAVWNAVTGGRNTNAFTSGQYGSRTVYGNHATGLNFVPYDGYAARLHQGEMVIPASLAERMRRASTGGFETLAAGMVNGIQTAMAGNSGGSYTFNLVMPDNTVLARYQLPALIDVARANGTPILNPVKA